MPRLPDPFAVVADFDLNAHIAKANALPDVDGEWANPASLSRFGRTEMDFGQFRRFAKKITLHHMGYNPMMGPCWLWGGGLHDKGYGRFHLGFDPKTKARIDSYAHRIAFEHWVCIPKPGYIVDHECEIKTCCNPAHLWPQTNEENLRLAWQRNPWKVRNQYSKE